MLDLIERRREDQDRLTVAIAQGYGISMDAAYAAKWQADRAVASGPQAEAIAKQSATIGRLARMFPGAVRKAN